MGLIILDHRTAAVALATKTLPTEDTAHNILPGCAADIAAETGCEADEIERMAEDMGMMFSE